MKRSARILCAVVLLATIGSTAAQFSETELEQTEAVFTEEDLAESWRLSMGEWAQYKTLMDGPRGIWSPNLDPITVLGIHAESEIERQRYAELLVMIEFERVEQELLFQRAYDEAAGRLYPTLSPVTVAVAEAPLSSLLGVERVAFFGSVDPERCPTCQRELARLMQMWGERNAPAVDLFLVDASDDEAIRTWASTQGVSPDAVRLGRVTLNHARESFSAPAAGSRVAPRLMRRVAGQWLPMALPR